MLLDAVFLCKIGKNKMIDFKILMMTNDMVGPEACIPHLPVTSGGPEACVPHLLIA